MNGFDPGKMIGPLPMGAWVAVVGGGLGFMLYTRKHTDPTAAAADTASAPPVDMSGGVGTGVNGQWVDVTPPTTGGNVAPKPTTNEDWGVLAVNYLIASGYNPAVADSAIRKYLSGAQQSVSEYALTMQALAHLGSPPSPLPASPFLPPTLPGPPVVPHPVPTPRPVPPHHPPVKQPAKKPTKRTYKVVKNDNLTKIGAKFHVSWQSIYNANRGVIGNNPNLIRPGMVLTIP